MEKLDIRNKADIDSTLPLISIIGRPNVGKSTLFNRLIGKRRAITDPTPGVTRDPIPERWLLSNNPVTLVDSGGVKLDKEGLDFEVSDKSLSLLGISDAIIFLMDCMDVTREDQMLIDTLRPYADKVVLVVNKVDDISRDDLVWNFFSYGYQRVVGISAAHGLGIEELEDTLLGMLDLEPVEEIPEEPESIKLAILGKPNTGKSTLMNLLTGREISIVSPIAGTTRDLVEGYIQLNQLTLNLIDTAGIRETEDVVEKIGIDRSKKAIEEATLVILVLDASRPLDEQDELLLELTKDKKRIIVYNKTDIAPKEGIAISAKNGEIQPLLDEIERLFAANLSLIDEPFLNNERQISLMR